MLTIGYRNLTILVIAAMLLMIGSYSLAIRFLSTPRPATSDEIKNLKENIEPLFALLNQSKITPTEAYCLKMAEEPWNLNIFDSESTVVLKIQKQTYITPSLIISHQYTGYLISSNTAIAFIDDEEYRIKETLLAGDYIVQDIQPRQVILQSKSNSSETIILPIAKEEDVLVP